MQPLLRSRLASGEPLLGTFVKSHDAALAEILAGAGFDFLIADLDHSSLGLGDLEHIVRAASLHAASVIVRLSPADANQIGRVLDLGATGIQLTDVTTVAALEGARGAAVYPPAGHRSLALSHRAARYGREPVDDYLRRAGDEFVLVAQIESGEGVAALPSLLESAAADAWFVGPMDLSASLGHPGRFDDPPVRAVLDDAVDTILGSGARLGIFARDGEDAVSWRGRGATLVAVSSDYTLLASAAGEVTRRWSVA